MYIKEKDLESKVLSLLDNPSVRDKKRSICSDTSSSHSSNPVVSGSKAELQSKTTSLEAEIKQLRIQLDKSQTEYRQAVSRMEEYKQSAEQLKTQCDNFEAENKKISDDNERLKKMLEKAKSELDARIKQFNELAAELQNAQEKERTLSAALEKANESVRALRERFSAPTALLDRYRSLSETVRKGLSAVICDKDETLFIASCSDSDHLKRIWEYTKTLVGLNGDTDSIEVLKDIFDYFFDVFNSSLSCPKYVRDNVEIGYSFDEDKYDRCAGSATSGSITQVLLRGYKSENAGDIICRSLVRV